MYLFDKHHTKSKVTAKPRKAKVDTFVSSTGERRVIRSYGNQVSHVQRGLIIQL